METRHTLLMTVKATILVCTGIFLLCAHPSPVSAKKEFITFQATPPTSGTYPTFVSLGALINEYVPEVNVTVQAGTGVKASTEAAIQGNSQIFHCAGDINIEAYNGTGAFEGRPAKSIRLAFFNTLATFMWIVREDSDIKTLQDLNGKPVDAGSPGSTTRNLCLGALDALGIKPSKLEGNSPPEASDAIRDKRIVMWMKGASAQPSSGILALQATLPIRFLSVTDDDFAKIQEKMPYLKRAEWGDEEHGYKGVPGCKTYAVAAGIGFTTQIDQELGYKMAKATFEHWDEYLEANPTLRAGSPTADVVLERTVKNAAIPIHAGVVQYLKEKGIDVPENLIAPEYKD